MFHVKHLKHFSIILIHIKIRNSIPLKSLDFIQCDHLINPSMYQSKKFYILEYLNPYLENRELK